MHIAIGPHNASFYKMLDELWEECEALMDKGITGNHTGAGAEGFSFTGGSNKALLSFKFRPLSQTTGCPRCAMVEDRVYCRAAARRARCNAQPTSAIPAVHSC